MAQVFGRRSPSTISRELRRSAHPTGYTPAPPARDCAQQQRHGRGRPPGKRHQEGFLFALVRHQMSDERLSAEQIALTLAIIYPNRR
jgi:IS30 family transposase